MKLKTFLATTAASTLIAGAASAQTVADSFDNLIDTVLGDDGSEVNAAFFAGAVNTAEVDASVDITGGSVLAPGSFDSTSDDITLGAEGFIDIAAESAAESTDGASGAASENSSAGRFTAGFADEDTFSFNSTSVTVEPVTQRIDGIETVAAGAINEAEFGIIENGAIVDSASEASTSATQVASSVQTVTGSDIGVVTGALNDANIDASVSMSMTNANLNVTDTISTTAVGALSDTNVQANFVGGSGVEVDTTAFID